MARALLTKTPDRCIFAVDISGFSRTTDPRLAQWRFATLHRLLRHALWSTRLVPWRQQSTGDGMLYLFPSGSRSLVVDMVAQLSRELREHNSRHDENERLRLRAAMESGEVTLPRFWWGIPPSPAVTRTFRMLDSKELHDRLEHGQDDLTFVMTEHIYDAVIKERYCTSYEVADFELLLFGRDAEPKTPPRAIVLRHGARPKSAASSSRSPATVLADWRRVPMAVVQDTVTGLVALVRRYARRIRTALLVLVPLALIVALALRALPTVRPLLLGCPIPTELVVLTAPELEEAVEDLAESFAVDGPGGCRAANVHVYAAASYSDVVRYIKDWSHSDALRELGSEPAVWIPSSTSVTRKVEAELSKERFERLESVATSPLVLAAEPDFKRQLSLDQRSSVTWEEIRGWEAARGGGVTVARADPMSSAAALLATERLYAGTSTEVKEGLEEMLRPAIPDELTELCSMGQPSAPDALDVQAPRALLTSELLMLARNDGVPEGCEELEDDAKLQALYPQDEQGRTPFLDYPYILLPSTFDGPRERREDLARKFHEHLLGEQGRTRLQGVAGFRTPGHRLLGRGSADGVDPSLPVTPTRPPGERDVGQVQRRWEDARPPTRVLLSMDVSHSMGEHHTAGGLRIDAARAAATEFVDQLTGEDYIGLWRFGDNLPPRGVEDYQELREMAPVDEQDEEGGRSQRERIKHELGLMVPETVGTRLYEMLSAGLEELRETGGTEVRGMVVVTDGGSTEQPDGGVNEVIRLLEQDDPELFLFLLVFGPAGCDTGGPAMLAEHPNALCIDANETGLPAGFAEIRRVLLGGGR